MRFSCNLNDANPASFAFLPWLVAAAICGHFPVSGEPNRTVLTYSTYLGGNSVDIAHAVAIDGQGNVYIAGETVSSDFPVTAGAFQTRHAGVPEQLFMFGTRRADAFVTKLDSSGKIVYSTLLGGMSDDVALAIAVDSAGNAYIAGRTDSNNFPVTAGAFQTAASFPNSPFRHIFVVKLDPSGSALVYGTLIGGSGYEDARSIAVDSSGNAYVAGTTTSLDFPVTAGAFQTSAAKSTGLSPLLHSYVAKLNANGSQLIYATYLTGGSGAEANALALNPGGDIVAAGFTTSSDFPVTAGAFQRSFSGRSGSFISHLNASGNALLYSTFLGGEITTVYAVATDATGNAYVTGGTSFMAFPATPGAFQTQLQGNSSAFVAKVNPLGTALLYSTLVGGDNSTAASSVAVDSSGNAYITGQTFAAGFPLTPDAYQTGYSAAPCFRSFTTPFMMGTVQLNCGDVFLAELDPSGSNILYSTYFGANGVDQGNGLALSAARAVYVTGASRSSNLPTTTGAIKGMRGPDFGCTNWFSPTATEGFSCDDAFLARFDLSPPAAQRSFEVLNEASQLPGAVAAGELVTLLGSGIGPDESADLTIDSEGHVSTTLEGVRVLFDNIPAPLIHVERSRIVTVTPYEIAGSRRVQVSIETNGIPGPAESVDVATVLPGSPAVVPGIFTLGLAGSGPAACINEDGSINSPDQPAAPGSIAAIYLTGLGPVVPPDADGSVEGIANLPKPVGGVTVYVGGQPVEVVYAGAAPTLISGVMQVNFRVPAISGNSVPLFVSAANVITSQSGVTIAIR